MLLRKILFQAHLWIGLTLGLLVSIVSLSGSVIVFQPEIDRLLNPSLLTAQGEGEPVSLDRVVEAAFDAYPSDAPPSFSMFNFPRHENGVFQVLMKEGFDPDDGPFLEAMVDPRSGQVLGIRDTESPFVYWMIKLHSTLLIDEEQHGEAIAALIASLGLLFFIASGLYLWWPGIRRFARGFRLRLRLGPNIALRDGHRVFGALSLLFLVLPIVTGLFIVFPQTMERPVRAALEVREVPPPPATVSDGTMSPAAALARAQAVVPDGEATGFAPPEGPDGYYRFRFRRPGEPYQHYTNGRVEVLVGQSAAAAPLVRDEAAWRLGERLLRVWMFPTHTGEIFGLPGRLLIFVAGLIPPFLFVSGLATWLLRTRASASRRAGTTVHAT